MPEYFKFNHDPAHPNRLLGIPFTEMVRIEKGTAYRLDNTNRPSSLDNPEDFYIGAYPVTQKLFERVMNFNPSQFRGESRPVETISWRELVQDDGFLSRINKLLLDSLPQSEWEFVLPFEYQWLYAAIKSNSSIHFEYSGGKEINDFGWCNSNSNSTMPVGLKTPNNLGIYDLCGNVSELCLDMEFISMGEPSFKPFKNIDRNSVKLKTTKGGSFRDFESSIHIQRHGAIEPNVKNEFTGFRLCLSKSKIIYEN